MAKYNPPVAHYRHFIVEDSWKPHMPKIIGKAGCHFIRITERMNVNYIWYNSDENRVEIWGPENKIEQCEEVLKRHILKNIE